MINSSIHIYEVTPGIPEVADNPVMYVEKLAVFSTPPEEGPMIGYVYPVSIKRLNGAVSSEYHA